MDCWDDIGVGCKKTFSVQSLYSLENVCKSCSAIIMWLQILVKLKMVMLSRLKVHTKMSTSCYTTKCSCLCWKFVSKAKVWNHDSISGSTCSLPTWHYHVSNPNSLLIKHWLKMEMCTSYRYRLYFNTIFNIHHTY